MTLPECSDLSGLSFQEIMQEMKNGKLHARFDRAYGQWFVDPKDYSVWEKRREAEIGSSRAAQ